MYGQFANDAANVVSASIGMDLTAPIGTDTAESAIGRCGAVLLKRRNGGPKLESSDLEREYRLPDP